MSWLMLSITFSNIRAILTYIFCRFRLSLWDLLRDSLSVCGTGCVLGVAVMTQKEFGNYLTAAHINSAWNICIVRGMWCIFNTCDECIFHTTEAQWIILPLWHWGRDLYSLHTPLHHLTSSPCLLYHWKLKDRFNVNFTVNLFCLSVSEIFIRAERKVAST